MPPMLLIVMVSRNSAVETLQWTSDRYSAGSLAGELAVSVRVQIVPFEVILRMPMPARVPHSSFIQLASFGIDKRNLVLSGSNLGGLGP